MTRFLFHKSGSYFFRKHSLYVYIHWFPVCRSVPRVSYVTCLDMWMVACILFVFLELVEFSFIFIMNKSNFSQLANRYSQAQEWGGEWGWIRAFTPFTDKLNKGKHPWKNLTSQSHNFLIARDMNKEGLSDPP